MGNNNIDIEVSTSRLPEKIINALSKSIPDYDSIDDDLTFEISKYKPTQKRFLDLDTEFPIYYLDEEKEKEDKSKSNKIHGDYRKKEEHLRIPASELLLKLRSMHTQFKNSLIEDKKNEQLKVLDRFKGVLEEKLSNCREETPKEFQKFSKMNNEDFYSYCENIKDELKRENSDLFKNINDLDIEDFDEYLDQRKIKLDLDVREVLHKNESLKEAQKQKLVDYIVKTYPDAVNNIKQQTFEELQLFVNEMQEKQDRFTKTENLRKQNNYVINKDEDMNIDKDISVNTSTVSREGRNVTDPCPNKVLFGEEPDSWNVQSDEDTDYKKYSFNQETSLSEDVNPDVINDLAKQGNTIEEPDMYPNKVPFGEEPDSWNVQSDDDLNNGVKI